MSTIDSLVTDRTQEDVDRAIYLNGLWVYDEAAGAMSWSGTSAELAEWTDGSKGAYNAEDLNRVGAAVEYVAGRFAAYGYAVSVSPKQDWAMGDIPREADMVKYLAEVEQLRSLISVMPTTPETPGDMANLWWWEANDIEQILKDLDFLLGNMAAAWTYSGEIDAGEC